MSNSDERYVYWAAKCKECGATLFLECIAKETEKLKNCKYALMEFDPFKETCIHCGVEQRTRKSTLSIMLVVLSGETIRHFRNKKVLDPPPELNTNESQVDHSFCPREVYSWEAGTCPKTPALAQKLGIMGDFLGKAA
jgi:hypothetical protein